MDINKKYRRYGNILYYLIRAIEFTVKVTSIFPENFDKDRNYVLAFWHNKVVTSLLGTKFIKRKVGLASPTKDGELIAVPLEKYGTKMVRGSSDKESVKSLIKLIKEVKDGATIGTPVDGPKGPIYEVKQGMVYIAQKSGVPLLPMGAYYSRKWIFHKAWDRFQLPKPFAKLVVVYGEPYIIPPSANLQEESEKLKAILNELDRRAEEICNTRCR